MLFDLFLRLLLNNARGPRLNCFHAIPTKGRVFVSVLKGRRVAKGQSTVILVPSCLPGLYLEIPSTVLRFLQLSLEVRLRNGLRAIRGPKYRACPRLLAKRSVFLKGIGAHIPGTMNVPFFLNNYTILVLRLIHRFSDNGVQRYANAS